MKTKIKLSTLVILLILAGSNACKNNTETPSDQAIVGAPPSLQEEARTTPVIVNIPDNQLQNLDIPLYTIIVQEHAISVTAPGEVYPAPNYIAIISAPVEGRILQLPLNEGDYVRKGQVLLELESLTFGTLVADFIQTHSEEVYQSSQLRRIQELVQKGISTESELEKVKADHARAQASHRASLTKLKTVGADDAYISRLFEEESVSPRLKITSPIQGKIDSHYVELGQAVAANEMIATVINLDKVMVKSFLTPEDGQLVAVGDTVKISHRLINKGGITGKVNSINPGLDEANRSVVVNTILDNPEGWMKPGDIIRTEIFTSATGKLIPVPLKAITYNNTDPVVFVKVDERRYEMRTVDISEFRNDIALVSSGLQVGEQIASGNVFSLKALARYELLAEE